MKSDRATGVDQMPQNEHIEEAIKKHGRRLDYVERKRKRAARAHHELSETAQKTRGLKAKMLNKKRYSEKAQIRKTIKQHSQHDAKQNAGHSPDTGPIPAY